MFVDQRLNMKLWLLFLLLESSQAQLLRPALTTSLAMSSPPPTQNASELSVTTPMNRPISSVTDQTPTERPLFNATITSNISETTVAATNEAPKDYDYPFYFITANQFINKSPGITMEESKELQTSLSGLQMSQTFEFELKGFPSIKNDRVPFYEMQMRYSSPSGDGAFLLYHVTQDESGAEELDLLLNVTGFNATASWQRYETMLVTSKLPLPLLFQDQDTAKVRVVVRQGGFNLMWFYCIAGNIRDVPGMTGLNPRRPARSPPAPGRVPFFQKFITVGDFVARSDDVVVEKSIKEGRSHFGHLNTTSWLQFRLSVPVTGFYNVHVRLSSPNGSGSFDLMLVEEPGQNATTATTAAASTSRPSQRRIATSAMPPPVTLQRPAVAMAPLPAINTTTPVLATTNQVGTLNGTSSSSRESLEWIASFEDFPVSGSWDQYTRITKEVVLEKGEHLYSINITMPGFNLVWLYFEPTDLMEVIDERGNGI